MMTPHFYETEVGWMGKKRGYLQAPGLPSLEVASPPEFNGHEHTWTPEHLFVAAVNSCYMATFVAIAELSKLDVLSFTSNAVGKLERTEGSGYRITEIVLKPKLVIKRETDAERAQRILEKAERNCFISNSILTEVKLEPEIDFEHWTLSVSGLAQKPGEYALAQIQALPKTTQNTRHVCVEGWDVIGNFGGARLRDFLQLIGADGAARFLYVECADGYYETLDVSTALHPQSLLCYEMYGKPLERGHGAPLRLSLPTKLGYKSAKYLTKLEVTNVWKPDRRGYWEDQGYSWFAGL